MSQRLPNENAAPADQAATRDRTAESIDQGGVTWRAVLVAMALVLVTAPAVFYGEIFFLAPGLTTGAPAAWPVAATFLLAAALSVRRLKRLQMSRRELLVVFSILLVATPLCSRSILFYVLPKVILYYHTARANPQWESTFLRLLPKWWGPSGLAVEEGFIYGGVRTPWGVWVGPLVVWGSVMIALWGSCFCLMAILQRQWISHERLAFPLAQIPLTMVEGAPSATGAAPARLPRARVFWLGLGIAFGLTFLQSLHARFPAIPAVPVGPTTLLERVGVGPLAGMGEIVVDFTPTLLGIVYLIPTDLSFSCMFFWVLRVVLNILAIVAGHEPQNPINWGDEFPAPWTVGSGAVIALGLWGFWIARAHIARAIRMALLRPDARLEASEPLPYRWALTGFMLCFGWLMAFCLLSGCRLLFAVTFMATIVGSYLVFAHVRADTALEPVVKESSDWYLTPIGTRALHPAETVLMVTMRWATFPVPSSIFSDTVMNTLDSLKVADAAAVRVRRLTYALVAGFVLCMAAGSYVMIAGFYRYGYYGTAAGAAWFWPSLYNRTDGGNITNRLLNPTAPEATPIIGMIAGGLLCIALGLLRQQFWWWPLHPVGLVIASGWGLGYVFVPFLIGWLAKTLVIRYGGLRLYRATVPVAVGLIVGDLLNQTLWSFISAIARSA